MCSEKLQNYRETHFNFKQLWHIHSNEQPPVNVKGIQIPCGWRYHNVSWAARRASFCANSGIKNRCVYLNFWKMSCWLERMLLCTGFIFNSSLCASLGKVVQVSSWFNTQWPSSITCHRRFRGLGWVHGRPRLGSENAQYHPIIIHCFYAYYTFLCFPNNIYEGGWE